MYIKKEKISELFFGFPFEEQRNQDGIVEQLVSRQNPLGIKLSVPAKGEIDVQGNPVVMGVPVRFNDARITAQIVEKRLGSTELVDSVETYLISGTLYHDGFMVGDASSDHVILIVSYPMTTLDQPSLPKARNLVPGTTYLANGALNSLWRVSFVPGAQCRIVDILALEIMDADSRLAQVERHLETVRRSSVYHTDEND